MPLEFQIQQAPFAFGLAEGTDPHRVPLGTLMTAENVRWSKSGKLEKRYGISAMASSILGGGSISACSRLLTRGTELALTDGSSLYSYSPGLASWRNVGKVPEVGLTWSTLADTLSGVAATDLAVSSGGILVHAWQAGDVSTASGSLNVQVVDTTNNGVLLAPQQLSASGNSGVRVLVIGTTGIVLTRNGNNLVAYTINLSTLAVSSATNLRTDMAATGGMQGFDACVIGTNFVIAYNQTGPNVKLYSYSTSLVQQATGGITGEASGARNISIDGAAGETLYVFYARGGADPQPVRVAMANPSTLAQTVAPVTVETPAAGVSSGRWLGVCRYDSSSCVILYAWTEGSPTTNYVTRTYKVSSTGTVDTSSFRGTYGLTPISKPFMMGGRCYYAALDQAQPLNSTFFGFNSVLAEIQVSADGASNVPHRCVGKVDELLGGTVLESTCLPNAWAISSTDYRLAVPFQATAAQETVNWRQGVRMLSMTLGTSRPGDIWHPLSYGQETYLSGSVLTAYDGMIPFDYGYGRGPALGLINSAAGGNIAAGTYLYGGVFEYRSSAGVLHRSPVAIGATVTTAGATSSVTVNGLGASLTNKHNSQYGSNAPLRRLFAVYRSTAGGSTLYRMTYEPLHNVTWIDEKSLTQAFVDTRSDTSIDGFGTDLNTRPTIYTAGGVLEDEQPVASISGFYGKNRLWLLAGDRRTWWFSKSFQDDLGVAPGFSVSFRLVFDVDMVGGIQMDEKVVFFSESGVWYMLGEGPAPSGQGSDFTSPQQIQTDVGCANARSLVGTPDGVMFQSTRGIYLLSRGLQITWIGRPVKDTLDAFPNVTSAVLVAKHNEVRFTCNNAADDAHVVLVYNYVEKQWSTTKYQGVGTIADAIVWNNVYTFATTSGAVYTESASSFLDAGTWVPMTIETAWVSAAGPTTFQSVRVMALAGVSNSNHDLTLSVGFDNDTSYPQTKTFLAGSGVTEVGPLEQCEITIGTRRKCQYIRFKIQDSTPTNSGSYPVGTGQGPSVDTIAIEVGIKKGFAGEPAEKRG